MQIQVCACACVYVVHVCVYVCMCYVTAIEIENTQSVCLLLSVTSMDGFILKNHIQTRRKQSLYFTWKYHRFSMFPPVFQPQIRHMHAPWHRTWRPTISWADGPQGARQAAPRVGLCPQSRQPTNNIHFEKNRNLEIQMTCAWRAWRARNFAQDACPTRKDKRAQPPRTDEKTVSSFPNARFGMAATSCWQCTRYQFWET